MDIIVIHFFVKLHISHLSDLDPILDEEGKRVMWYYCAVTGESKKIVFTTGATEKITSGGATSDFWSPHIISYNVHRKS
jgi:hypothetical protein